jgi:hypothetical protein
LRSPITIVKDLLTFLFSNKESISVKKYIKYNRLFYEVILSGKSSSTWTALRVRFDVINKGVVVTKNARFEDTDDAVLIENFPDFNYWIKKVEKLSNSTSSDRINTLIEESIKSAEMTDSYREYKIKNTLKKK